MQLELFTVTTTPPIRQTPQFVLDIVAKFKDQDEIALRLAIESGIITAPIDLKQAENPLYCQIWDHYWETIGRSSHELPRPDPSATKEARRNTWSKEAKARERRRRLKQRIIKKFSIPSMFEAEYQKRIQENPKYFIEGEYSYANG